MVQRWIVDFVDDESDDIQHAFFSSKAEAEKWIKNVEVQERYDPTGFEVVDGPLLKEKCVNILSEGKHWPEDYIKTAYNTIKNSQLGQQSWYSDSFIQQDVKTFADEFEPLSHKNSNLGFFAIIIKWFINYSGSSEEKYQGFIERKLDGIIGTLQVILNDPSYDKIKDKIKQNWTLEQFEELQKKIADEAKASSDEKIKNIVKRDDYDLIPIYSYEELHEKFGGDWTGWHGQSEWCHTNGKSTYESWTKNGTQMFFVLAKKDWQKVFQPEYKPTGKDYNAYDEYGLSLIAILVDVVTENLLNETLRWNHVIEPSHTNPGASVDKAFKNNWGALSQAVGMDVKAECEKELKSLREKLENLAKNANKEVIKILSYVNKITEDTIPENIKKHLTSVVIPNSVTSIESQAFSGCSRLTSVTIPDSVMSIGYSAFYNCTNVTDVVVPGWKCAIPFDAVTNLVISEGATSIWNYAFYGCSRLTSVTIPDSVMSIEYGAFRDCTNLTSVIIPNSVTSIRDYAFWGCSSLTNVMIPNSVTSIGDHVFEKCNNLNNLIFKDKILEEVKKMKNYPFGIEDESIIKCEQNSLYESFNEDLKFMFESCNIALGRQLSFAQSGEKYDEVGRGNFAYDVAEKCLRSNMSLGGVWSVDNNKHYVASIFGGNNSTKLDRRLWVSYLQEVEQMISNMLENGCGSVWLVDFINDPLDDAWELRIGFDLLSSPFRDDR